MPLILFTSPKGGVGKTTLSAHVAATLAARGHRVLALDLDPQNALRLHLGLSIREEAGFLAQLEQGADWRACVIRTPSGVRLLPFGATEPKQALDLSAALLREPDLLANPVRAMLAEPGLILIADSPPGPSSAVAAVSGLADLAVLVMLADAGSASLLPQILSGKTYGRGTLGARLSERAGVVLNQVDLDNRLSAAVLDSAAQLLGPRLFGAVCRDDGLAEALADRRLLTSGPSPATEDLALLTDELATRLKLPAPGGAWSDYSALAEWGLR